MDANDATKDSSRYKLLLKVPYQLKEGEVKIKVSGNVHDLCPDDGCSVISELHYTHIRGNYLQWSPKGYVLVHYKEDNARRIKSLSRYIWENIEGLVVPNGHVLHHKDYRRFNNTISNLDVATYSENNSDRLKQANTSSMYKGVCWSKACSKWQSSIRVDNKRVQLGVFVEEYGAAKAYDVAWISLYGKIEAPNKLVLVDDANDILKNREQYYPKQKRESRALPKYITKHPNGYMVRVHKFKIEKFFPTLEQACVFREEVFNSKTNVPTLQVPIKRDDTGSAVLSVDDRNTNTTVFSQVDDDMYFSLTQHKWWLDREGYVRRANDAVLLHSIVLPNTPADQQVDHKDPNNKLDNRKENLRYASRNLQAINKRKRQGCSSEYKGVTKTSSGKYKAQIAYQGVYKSLGLYDIEEDAANAYQNAVQNVVVLETTC
jgi:hypothetical protein